MPVYTKKGDGGKSSLLSGNTKLDKGDLVFHALGQGDELCSYMGLARETLSAPSLSDLHSQLGACQECLIEIGSLVASVNSPAGDYSNAVVEAALIKVVPMTSQLEKWIDEMEGELRPLANFLLPGGCVPAAHLHVSRTICRRWERSLKSFLSALTIDDSESRCAEVLPFANRLSDFLFVAARFANAKLGGTERVYKNHKVEVTNGS